MHLTSEDWMLIFATDEHDVTHTSGSTLERVIRACKLIVWRRKGEQLKHTVQAPRGKMAIGGTKIKACVAVVRSRADNQTRCRDPLASDRRLSSPGALGQSSCSPILPPRDAMLLPTWITHTTA